MRLILVGGAAATLFFLELHTGHRLLPRLGGGAIVWLGTVVMFQVLLLVAYASTLLPWSERVRTAVVVTALILGAALGPGTVAGLLLIGLALPTFLPGMLRSGTDAPRATRGRWIAGSNLGSLLGLATYAVLEPVLGIARGDLLLRVVLLALAAGLASQWRILSREVATRWPRYRPSAPAVLAAGVGVFWYMSLHARIEATFPASPQLWAVTLGLYLMSFAIPFVAGEGAAWRRVTTAAALIALGLVVVLERRLVEHATLVGILALLAGCTAAHAVLRDRFDSGRPWLHGAVDAALGGAMAGILTLVALPITLTTAQQLGLAMAVLAALLWREPLARPARLAVLVVAIAGAFTISFTARGPGRVVQTVRSWYGEFTVREYDAHSPLHRHYALYHQQTIHGAQYLSPELLDLPTAYFSIYSGVGIALRSLQRTRGAEAPLRLGVLGLGTGTVTTYADANDLVRFFEIDPRNVLMSSGEDALFTFTEQSRARVEFEVGDGRRLLRAEEGRGEPRYDALLLDAFAGGSPPTHLLTREAFDLWFARVRPDGWLLVNTSNHVLDLRPVVYAAARERGLRAVFVRNKPRPYKDFDSPYAHLTMRADWIVIGGPEAPWPAFEPLLAHHLEAGDLSIQVAESVTFDGLEGWTDDRRSVWSVWQPRVSARERLVNVPR